MNTLRIGIDIDDVLLKSAKRSIELYNETYGTALTLDDWYSFDDPAVWTKKWGHDDFKVLVSRVVDTMTVDAFASVEPLEDAPEVLSHLQQQGHELFAITGRSGSIRKQTKFALDKYYEGIFTDETLYFVDHFNHDGHKASKADLGQQLELTHFVEDHLDHANQLARVGIKTVLFSPGYKWNERGADEDVQDTIVVLGGWKPIEAYLDAEAAK